jgi:hypothetical protein
MSAASLRPEPLADLELDLATPADDAGLRRLLRENPMPGNIELAFEREPSAFLAASVEGDPHHIIVAREARSGRVVGMGSRAVREVFVNGAPCRVGYLSQLRLERGHRGRRQLLAGGYALLRALRAADEAPFDLTSIVADNRAALRLLSAGLPGLPAYRALATFVTLVMAVKRRRSTTSASLRLERGSRARMEDVAACLELNRRRSQFGPRFSAADLLSPERSRGLRPEDFQLAVRQGRVVGCLAVWNQAAFKQVVVRGYARSLGYVRPWLNAAAPFIGVPRLPALGEALPHAFVSHVAVDDDDAAVYQALLDGAHADAREGGFSHLLVGFVEGHPFLRLTAHRYSARRYSSILHAVYWTDGLPGVPKPNGLPGVAKADGNAALDRLDGRLPHAEVALL